MDIFTVVNERHTYIVFLSPGWDLNPTSYGLASKSSC